MSFRLGKRIGYGSYGKVIHAVDTTLGTAVAIKKSRVSLRVKRTILHYEARILQHLQGHPAIPSLVGYGRFPHFEYLAIQLCGESVQALAPCPQGTQLKTVLLIARQMISALEYIHSRGIIHRDVKPDHFLLSLQDPLQLVFVDYGISRPFEPGQKPKRYDPELEHREIVGTFKWASLNSHHGLNLSYRDDLESLAYVLLYLLRGGLPWEKTPGERGTIFGKLAQIRTLKTLWSGSELAEGRPQEFGRFLDEARALEFKQVPPYAQYLRMFDDLYSRAGFDDSPPVFDWSPVPPQDVTETRSRSTEKLVPGQLVSVELLSKPTILGITPDNPLWDTDFVNDLGDVTCVQPLLPAVILSCTLEESGRQYVEFGILRRGDVPPNSQYASINIIRAIDNLEPPWRSNSVHCYLFPEAGPFMIVENLAPSINYRISDEELPVLRDRLAGQIAEVYEVDVLAFKSMEKRNDEFHKLARVRPLESEAVDWDSARGWFDQIVSISRRRAVDDAWPWTGTGAKDDDDGVELSNSYHEYDLSEWDDKQQERDATLTLAPLDLGEHSTSLDITPISEIIHRNPWIKFAYRLNRADIDAFGRLFMCLYFAEAWVVDRRTQAFNPLFRPAVMIHLNAHTVIEIPSSPEPIPQSVTRSRNAVKSKRAPRSKTTQSSQASHVIELTDSDSEDDLPARVHAKGHTPRRPIAGPSSRASGSQLQPKVGASSSLENIPTHHRKVRAPTSKTMPLFHPSDEENNPPTTVVTAPPEEHSTPFDVHNPMQDIQPQIVPDVFFEEQITLEPEPDPISGYVSRILEIIPDVEPDHLLELVTKHVPQYQGAVVEHVLHVLFEDPAYPKVDRTWKGKRKQAQSDLDMEGDNASSPKKPKIDYANKERPFTGGSSYLDLALEQLQMDFPYIPKAYLRTTLADHNSLYAPTHLSLRKLNKQQDQAARLPYIARMTPFRPSAKGKKRDLQDDELTVERAWLLAEITKQDSETEAPGQPKLDEDEDCEDGIECGCCFSSYPFSTMVQCPETHLFCSSCMTSYAETLLGSHDPNISCMDQSGCKAAIPASELRRFLPDKLMELWERVKQRKEVEAAGLEGLEECPFCEWGCVIENEEEKLFRCGNLEGCGAVSCRGCKKLDHLPKSCKEMEEDKHLDGRHAIEEAMTRALMRKCPKCEKPFVKEAGCNKMTCPNCRTLSCYVCRQIITGYEHFNQNPAGLPGPSSAAGKCLLSDSVEQRHADEVKQAAEAALEVYKRDHPDVDEKEIKVDLPVAAPPPLAGGYYHQNFVLAQANAAQQQAQLALERVRAEVERLEEEEFELHETIQKQEQDILLIDQARAQMPYMGNVYGQRRIEMSEALERNRARWYFVRIQLQGAQEREPAARADLEARRQAVARAQLAPGYAHLVGVHLPGLVQPPPRALVPVAPVRVAQRRRAPARNKRR